MSTNNMSFNGGSELAEEVVCDADLHRQCRSVVGAINWLQLRLVVAIALPGALRDERVKESKQKRYS